MPSFSGEAPIRFLGATFLPQAVWILATTLAVVVALRVFFARTLTGLAMRAVAANRFSAALMGINIKAMVACSFAMAGAVGAVAGVIITPVALTAYHRGTILGLKGFSAAIVGGLGSSPGAVVGGLLLGVLESVGAGFVSSGYKDAIAFLLLIVMLLVRPQGLLGARSAGRRDEARRAPGLLRAGRAAAVRADQPLPSQRDGVRRHPRAARGGPQPRHWLHGPGVPRPRCVLRRRRLRLRRATAKLGMNPWLAAAAALGISMVIALAIGIPSLHLQGYYLSVATLGFGIILHIVFIEMAWLTGGPSGLVGIPEVSLFGVPLNTDLRYYVLVLAVVGITLIGAFRLVDSRLGRALRAIGADETAATLSGINTWAAKVQIFVIAAGIASLGGSLYAHYITFLSPDSFGFMFSVELIVMVVVGGTRSIWGSVVGAVLLTVLPEYLRVLKDYDVLVYGAIVIVVVMWAPSGIAWLARRALARCSPSRRGGGGGVNVPGTLLDVRGVGKTFGGLRALTDLSFAVARGSIKAVIGPNGRGRRRCSTSSRACTRRIPARCGSSTSASIGCRRIASCGSESRARSRICGCSRR